MSWETPLAIILWSIVIFWGLVALCCIMAFLYEQAEIYKSKKRMRQRHDNR